MKTKSVNGIVPGGTAHRMMLALRAGRMTSDQVAARFGSHKTDAAWRLRKSGLINEKADGYISLTDNGKALVEPGGPLSRSRSLITYCEL